MQPREIGRNLSTSITIKRPPSKGRKPRKLPPRKSLKN
jgi:hypothetical protein